MMDIGHDRFRDSGTRCIRFQAATATAATDAPVGVNHYVSNVSRCAGQASIHAAILHDTGTNTSADNHADEVAEALSRAIDIFAQRGNFNMVAYSYWHTKLLS